MHKGGFILFSKKPKTQTGPTCGPYAIANGLYLTGYIEKKEINPLVIQILTNLFQKNESYVGEIFSSSKMNDTIEEMIANQNLKIIKKSTKNVKQTQLDNDLNHLQPNEFAIIPIRWGNNLHWIGVIHRYGKLKYYDNHTRSLMRVDLKKITEKCKKANNVIFQWQPWINRKIKKNKYHLHVLARIGKHKPILELINQHLQEIDIQKLKGQSVKIESLYYFLIKEAPRKKE